MQVSSGAACARAALAGNPSDGYGGAVLAVTLPELQASATACRAPQLQIEPPSELVEATVRRFAHDLDRSALETSVRWSTSIPRGVGLGGSSAIVIAVLRSLGCELAPGQLASLALGIETEELGITAGLQDRVAQAYEGLTFMDFGEDGCYEPLDPTLLPPLVIAWRTDAAEDSHAVHGDLRARFDAGDPQLEAGMRELAALARAARDALLRGDLEAFERCVEGTFDVRSRILTLDPQHVAMVELARQAGASANYTGSGGAIVAACRDAQHRASVAAALRGAGCGVAAV